MTLLLAIFYLIKKLSKDFVEYKEESNAHRAMRKRLLQERLMIEPEREMVGERKTQELLSFCHSTLNFACGIKLVTKY